MRHAPYRNLLVFGLPVYLQLVVGSGDLKGLIFCLLSPAQSVSYCQEGALDSCMMVCDISQQLVQSRSARGKQQSSHFCKNWETMEN